MAIVLILNHDYSDMSESLYLRSIEQTSSHLDSIISDLQNDVSDFPMSDEDGSAPDHAIISFLNNEEVSSRLTVSALYYRIGDEGIYTSSGYITYAEFEEGISQAANLDQSGFFTRLNNSSASDMWMLDPPSGAENISPRLTAFMFPVYGADMRRAGTVTFLVNSEDLTGIVEEYLGIQPDYLYLYTASYNSLISMYEAAPQSRNTRGLALRSAVNLITHITMDDGERYDVLQYKSDRYGFCIISCVKLRNLYVDMSSITLRTVLIGITLGILILLGSFFMARWVYRPIRALITQIDTDGGNGENEFALINRHLASVHSEMRELHERLALQRPMVRDRLLQAMLRGTLDEKGLRQLENVCPGMHPAGRQAFVALANTPFKESSESSQGYLEELVLNGAEAYGVYIEDEQMFAWVVFCADNSRIREYALQIRELMQSAGLAQQCIFAGSVVSDPLRVSRSFLEAYIAAERSAGDSDVVLSNGSNIADAQSGSAGDSQTDMYLQSFRTVDCGTALQLLHSVLDSIQSGHGNMLNISYVRFDLYARTLRLSEPDVVEQFRDRPDIMEAIVDEASFRVFMEQLTSANCASVAQRRSRNSDSVKEKILNELREQFCDADFSISELSEKVGYSTTYINRCLKDETGYSFIQYLSLLRINRAKELLLGSDKRIKDIVALVGYLDMASFTRKFKEYEGVTPGQYRELNGKTGE